MCTHGDDMTWLRIDYAIIFNKVRIPWWWLTELILWPLSYTLSWSKNLKAKVDLEHPTNIMIKIGAKILTIEKVKLVITWVISWIWSQNKKVYRWDDPIVFKVIARSATGMLSRWIAPFAPKNGLSPPHLSKSSPKWE